MQRVIRAFDLFGYEQFTLYRSQQKYSTLTGGVASLIILGALIAIFISMTIQTLSYSGITANVQTSYDPDPTAFSRKINAQNKFAIAVGLTAGQDFPFQRLDVTLLSYKANNTASYLNKYQSKYIRMQACNFSDWDGISDQISKEFTRMQINKMLCFPKDFQFEIQGNAVSQITKYYRIQVSSCLYSDCQTGSLPYLQSY